ncbi:hypothetical protein HH308_11180 [Gordonia sp. TBRC 11910]|uniref:Uncharacterized protein n=1 Tax=Gordonia asplenii TaxID=2725283 RepID=A0A848KSW2_9ACTN|nr:hypothetical protein [Gordonia asplenii]NMO01776.1 hypothetical protein [Gordonia asplenii]
MALGREMLAREMAQPVAPNECGCAKCVARATPFSENEITATLAQLDDRDAARFAMGAQRLLGFQWFDDSQAWVPSFINSVWLDEHGEAVEGARVLRMPLPTDVGSGVSAAAQLLAWRPLPVQVSPSIGLSGLGRRTGSGLGS